MFELMTNEIVRAPSSKCNGRYFLCDLVTISLFSELLFGIAAMTSGTLLTIGVTHKKPKLFTPYIVTTSVSLAVSALIWLAVLVSLAKNDVGVLACCLILIPTLVGLVIDIHLLGVVRVYRNKVEEGRENVVDIDGDTSGMLA